MQIKLSDYIMEQTISEASMFDIEMEQSLAEVEVSVALCEAYFKQLAMGNIVQEADGNNQSGDDTSYTDHGLVAPNKKSIGGFFKAVGNFVVKIITKLLGTITESRIKSVLKKLNKYTEEQLKSVTVKAPKSIAESMDGWATNSKMRIWSFVEDINHFLAILEHIQLGITSDASINELLKDANTFKQGLYTKLKSRRAEIKGEKNNSETADCDLYTVKQYLETELDDFTRKGNEIKNLQQTVSKYKNLGAQLASAFENADEQDAKRIYKAVKSIYDMWSTYVSNQLRAEMQLLDLANIEKALKTLNKPTASNDNSDNDDDDSDDLSDIPIPTKESFCLDMTDLEFDIERICESCDVYFDTIDDSDVYAESGVYKQKIVDESKGFKVFLDTVGNWFVKVVTQMMGTMTEKNIKSTLKKLEGMSADKRAEVKIKIPRAARAAFEKGESFVDAFDKCKEFLDIFESFHPGGDISDNSAKNADNISSDQINKLLKSVESFKQGLRADLKANASVKEDANYAISGDEIVTFLKRELSAYNDKKAQIKGLRSTLLKNKNIGKLLADKLVGTDEKSAKRIYKAIKSMYEMFSTYMANRLTAEMKLINIDGIGKKAENPKTASQSPEDYDGKKTAKQIEKGKIPTEEKDVLGGYGAKGVGDNETSFTEPQSVKKLGGITSSDGKKIAESSQDDIGDSDTFIEFDFDD